MPFYCEKYATFLGMDAGKKVLRCSACEGLKQDFIQTGLSLLEAQMLPQGLINQMKQAFLQMPLSTQKTFVSILEQTGCQLYAENEEKLTPFSLMKLAQRARLTARRREEAPEVQEFIKLLDVIGGEGDPLDGMTKTLLSNLFQVLDGSERSMLLSILENPKNLESFLKSFGKTPHDKDLLKNFRALLYDAYQNLSEKQSKQSFLQQIKQDQMARMIQQMTKARSMKMHSLQNGRERN